MEQTQFPFSVRLMGVGLTTDEAVGGLYRELMNPNADEPYRRYIWATEIEKLYTLSLIVLYEKFYIWNSIDC